MYMHIVEMSLVIFLYLEDQKLWAYLILNLFLSYINYTFKADIVQILLHVCVIFTSITLWDLYFMCVNFILRSSWSTS